MNCKWQRCSWCGEEIYYPEQECSFCSQKVEDGLWITEEIPEIISETLSTDTGKYFRRQIIPLNPSTMVYWIDYEDGKVIDILPENIPDQTIVVDVTYHDDERKVRKIGDSFFNE